MLKLTAITIRAVRLFTVELKAQLRLVIFVNRLLLQLHLKRTMSELALVSVPTKSSIRFYPVLAHLCLELGFIDPLDGWRGGAVCIRLSRF